MPRVHSVLCPYRLKERRPLPRDDPHYQVSVEPDDLCHCLLSIPDTYTEDAGWYMCLAHNEAGTAYSEAQLLVESEYSLHHPIFGITHTIKCSRWMSLLLMLRDVGLPGSY